MAKAKVDSDAAAQTEPVVPVDPVTPPADAVSETPAATTPDVPPIGSENSEIAKGASDPIGPADAEPTPEPIPEPEPDPLLAARITAREAKAAAQKAEAAVLEAERVFDGLLPAATSAALIGHIHSVEEIERGYTLAMDAHSQRLAARDALVVAWEEQDKAETDLLDLEHAALLEARHIADLSTPTA